MSWLHQCQSLHQYTTLYLIPTAALHLFLHSNIANKTPLVCEYIMFALSSLSNLVLAHPPHQ